MVDWKKIKAEYIKGGTSYRKLSEKHDVPFGTLRKVAVREKWTELRAKAGEKADTKIVDAEANRRAKNYKRLMDVTDELLSLVEKVVRETKTQDLLIDKSVLRQISGTLKDIKDIQSIKSELEIQEQKAKIALLEKQADVDEDNGIEIVITGKAEEYAK